MTRYCMGRLMPGGLALTLVIACCLITRAAMAGEPMNDAKDAAAGPPVPANAEWITLCERLKSVGGEIPRELLAADTPKVDRAARAADLAMRRGHAARRWAP